MTPLHRVVHAVFRPWIRTAPDASPSLRPRSFGAVLNATHRVRFQGHAPATAILLVVICTAFIPTRDLHAGEAANVSQRLQLWDALAATDRTQPALPVQGVMPYNLRDSFDEPRSHGRRHAAIDIMAPRNTPVLAAVDGEIRKLTTSSRGGLTIYQFDESRSRVYYYAHLERYRPGLRERSFVHRGEIIGYVGTSGNASPGAPHLHFAIAKLNGSQQWWKGVPVDPYPLLVGNAKDEDSTIDIARMPAPSTVASER